MELFCSRSTEASVQTFLAGQEISAASGRACRAVLIILGASRNDL